MNIIYRCTRWWVRSDQMRRVGDSFQSRLCLSKFFFLPLRLFLLFFIPRDLYELQGFNGYGYWYSRQGQKSGCWISFSFAFVTLERVWRCMSGRWRLIWGRRVWILDSKVDRQDGDWDENGDGDGLDMRCSSNLRLYMFNACWEFRSKRDHNTLKDSERQKRIGIGWKENPIKQSSTIALLEPFTYMFSLFPRCWYTVRYVCVREERSNHSELRKK